MKRWLAPALLAWIAAWFLVYVSSLVPHLVNNSFADIEFTGWSGPIGARIAAGERPYTDFVLPIPPGSLALLAFIGKLAGRQLLIQELWVNAVCHLLMGLLAYAIAVRFTSRPTALAVAVLSLVSVVTLNKECAYDHTAQVVAWSSVAVGARALLADAGRRRRRLWLCTGVLAALVIVFKQSTGIGAIAGFSAALAYSACFEWLSGRRESARAVLRDDATAFATGVALGSVIVVGFVLSLGSSFGAFFQCVFRDGPELKGGTALLLHNLFNYLVVDTTFPASLGALAILVWIGARIRRFEGRLHLGDEPGRDPAITPAFAVALAVAVLVLFGSASFWLHTPGATLTPEDVHWFDRSRVVAAFGLGLVAMFLVIHARRRADGVSDDALRAGHAQSATCIAALVISLLHNTSAPEFRAFYDNNPIIPLSWLMLLVVLRRARLRPVAVLAFAVFASTLYGNKLARALGARAPMGSHGWWAGMQVSDRGLVMAKAALRVREIAGPHDTVLVLPEDVNFAALVGRPRPPIRGAIVFVDQYPRRLAAGDIATLRAHPPDVIVLEPAERLDWQRIFRIWNGDSGAERVIDFALRDLLPHYYRLDRRYPTSFLGSPATLEIWVRARAP